MKRKYALILILILGLGVSLSVQAEPPILTLSQVEGVVLVNQGKRFARAHNGMALTAGDRILTMKQSQVALKSEKEDCASLLRGNTLLTVTESLDCETLTSQAEVGKQRYAALGDPESASPGDEGVNPQGAGNAGTPTPAQGPGALPTTGSAMTGGAISGTGGAVAAAGSMTGALITGGVVIGAGVGGTAALSSTSEKGSPD